MQDKVASTKRRPAENGQRHSIAAELIAVLVAVTIGQPRVMTIERGQSLPSGPFELGHRSLQSGLRDWVEQQTKHPLGYIEQLYTFADRDRAPNGSAQRAVSISYLALTREEQAASADEAAWRSWYDYFPWEDHRAGIPSTLPDVIVPRLKVWADAADDQLTHTDRWQRAAMAFGLDGYAWNEELVLQRYELLYEAAFVEEADRCHGSDNPLSVFGRAMQADHRRILATGIARLRAKIKYRPVVFELMPPTFTLLQLQRTVEALAGRLLHKQNFRRLIEQQDLVEETGETVSETRGPPAKRFRFRQTVLAERTVAGTKLPLSSA
ncbi:NUDIX hydrolase [Pseudaminobacter sp. NGMCC 1.201702]|uniref:NUDIX hydrolase n=1 Tax=Pseudaminobacter sp. NGMCC 1.201702 TaxID=3391825 RepID=UPI0039F08C9B